MKTNDTLPPADPQEASNTTPAGCMARLVRSIFDWEAWANERLSFGEKAALLNPACFRAEIAQARKDYSLGMRTAKSLRMENGTGVPHCVCCLKPHTERGMSFLSSANA